MDDDHNDNLRDLYAGLAMLGLIGKNPQTHVEAIASWAFNIADHMMVERNKYTKQEEQPKENQ